MLFNSLQFLVFFPLIVTLYFLISFRFRWILLLLGSYYFYMCWKPPYLVLILMTTLINYLAGIMIARVENQKKRRFYLTASIVGSLGLLFFFKYFNFFNLSLGTAMAWLHIPYHIPYLHVLLPVGISFYTFQAMGYTIDVYRNHIKPERHLGIFSLYVAFFPQLVAGPIERARNLLPQFYQKCKLDYTRITNGLKLMLWGFFKKVVVADRLAILVNQVYGDPTEYTGPALIIATYFFAFQIYCDFSGYSDIAIGAAEVMGYRLMTNFKRPYFAQSISEFWKRWHISLSTWFKDFLYIPLGGNRVPTWRWYYNVIVVFLVSGLWHGANWTFVIWGGLHGTYMLVGIWTKALRARITKLLGLEARPRLHKTLRILITFHLAVFAWIFFRAGSLSDAVYIVSHLFTSVGSTLLHIGDWAALREAVGDLGLPRNEFIIAVISIFLMECVHVIQERGNLREFLARKPLLVRWAVYYSVIFSILLFGVLTKTEFIYFQF